MHPKLYYNFFYLRTFHLNVFLGLLLFFCRDALDLKISKGIRKPCYSTNLSFASPDSLGAVGGSSLGQEEAWQHSSPVVQVEALGTGLAGGAAAVAGGSAAVSQFVSVDESGMLIFWVTSSSSSSASSTAASAAAASIAEDLQRSPWSGVVLVQTRQIHTHSHTLYRNPVAGKGFDCKFTDISLLLFVALANSSKPIFFVP
jgi:hypothetical protein